MWLWPIDRTHGRNVSGAACCIQADSKKMEALHAQIEFRIVLNANAPAASSGRTLTTEGIAVNELSMTEIDQVGGGDSWAGTPEGRAPADSSKFRECMTAGLIAGGDAINVLVGCAVDELMH